MNIDVAFTPSEVQALSRKVCVIIDVLRASSTMVVLMSRFPSRVILTPTVQKAVKFASQQKVHPLLCGERGGFPPQGFDYGNSPREYVAADLHGRTVVFTSGIGTRAIADVYIAPHVYLGSFLNASAVIDQSLKNSKEENLDILFVCAGKDEKFALDDAFCAGYFVSLLAGKIPPDQKFILGDGGQAALGIYGYFRDAEKVLESSGSGQSIREIGLEEDIPFIIRPDVFETVPTLVHEEAPGSPKWGFSLLV